MSKITAEQLASGLSIAVAGLRQFGESKAAEIAAAAQFLLDTFREVKATAEEFTAIAEQTQQVHDAGWPEDQVAALLAADKAQRHADLERLKAAQEDEGGFARISALALTAVLGLLALPLLALAQGVVDPVAQGTDIQELLAALSVPMFVAGGIGSIIRNMLATDNRWIPAAQLVAGTGVTLLWTGDYSGKGIIIGMLAGLSAYAAREVVAQTADRFKRPPDDDIGG